MKHDIKELYTINGRNGTYTEAYLHAHGIRVGTHHQLLQEGYATKCYYKVSRGTINIIDVCGKRTVYMYGEKTWFDTLEECQAHRIAENAKAAEKRLRIIAKSGLGKKIDEMTIPELRKFMEKMGLW